jgi:hypothetical protein
LGTAAAVEDVIKPWFVNLLKKVRENFIPKLGLNRIKYILGRFLWIERTSGIDSKKVYKDKLDLELKGDPYETEIDLRPEYKVLGNN